MRTIMDQVMNSVVDNKAEGDLIFSTGSSLRMSSQDGKISNYNVAGSQILGIRVIKDGKVGLSYTESLDPSSLQLLVHSALQNAVMSESKKYEHILKLSGHLTDETNYAERLIDIEIKTAKALELEMRVRREDSRVTAVPYNGYSESENSSYYLSTSGRSTSYFDKQYSISTSALLEESKKKAYFGHYHVAHSFDELKWDNVIETSLFHAKNLLREEGLPTGKYQVRFTEDCLKSLVECFANFYSGKSAMDKLNPWADKIGSEVISSELTISDDPKYPDAFRHTRFDSEGVEASSLILIKNGRLESLMHNSITGEYFNTQTTGHAWRSPGGPLEVSGTHFVINGERVKPLPPSYLEVIQLDGLYSGANRVTGDFSVGVKGYVWKAGERVCAFGNVTLSGNLMELLKNVEVVGNNIQASTDRGFFSVPLLFHQMSIAGS